MKYCWDCKKTKPFVEFCKDRCRPDGYRGRCKNCDRLYRREKRKRNPETYKKRDKRYYEKNRDKRLEYAKEWRKKNKHKEKAYKIIKQAMIDSELERQPCEVCGTFNSEAHHNNYSKPLEVRWFCRRHHMRHHNTLASPTKSISNRTDHQYPKLPNLKYMKKVKLHQIYKKCWALVDGGQLLYPIHRTKKDAEQFAKKEKFQEVNIIKIKIEIFKN